ncbi:hypothetical protein HHI36_012161 [Cryptolaemus montrouzieri]|uniref:Androglobin n=1 Tax=Cryptolaemus montrouzieri TaxID=559131 RepID=A0ABD2NDH2_9CUCU
MSEKTRTKTSGSKIHQNQLEKLYVDLVTPIPDQIDPKNIPFPEWSDDEVNFICLSAISTLGKIKEKGDKLDKDRSEEPIKIFEDPQVLFLPFCLQDEEKDWKRPQQIFSEYQLVVFKDSLDYHDLLNSSSHLFNSTFMRSFVSSVNILEYLASTTHFNTEARTIKYTPNASGVWRPWHHIYSGAKVGPGTIHNPQISLSGKYHIRLFWMGCWRRIVIDDFLPVDATGHVLLPSLPFPSIPLQGVFHSNISVSAKEKGRGAKAEKEVEKPIFEIWPFLLCKGLLKLANMTMNKDQDMLDFDIIHCLTGWVLQTLELDGISSEDKWNMCKTYTKLFSWETKQIESSQQVNKRKKSVHKILAPKQEDIKPHYFIVHCEDMRSLKPSSVQGMSPCWSHDMIIDECRDLPLDEPSPNPEYPLWKTFRWMEWAKARGEYTDPIVLDRTKYVKCVSAFKQFSKLTVHKEPDMKDTNKNRYPLSNSRTTLPKILPEKSKSQEKLRDVQSSPRSELSKKGKSKEKKVSLIPPDDPSVWIKFEDLCQHLLNFKIFFKPSVFDFKARISDLDLNDIIRDVGVKKVTSSLNIDRGDDWQNVKWANGLQERRNEPLYFFIDSLLDKMMLINLCQAGDVERLVPFNEELSEDNFFVEYERLFGEKNQPNADGEVPPRKLKINRARIHANLKISHMIFECYSWDSAKTGNVTAFLNSYGNKSTLLELASGRHIFRVWVKSEFPFCITILADTPFTVGCLEMIMEPMAEEPMQITQFANDITVAFANLITTFGTQEFSQSLKKFYCSYMPKNANKQLTSRQRLSIHETFKKSLISYLGNIQDIPSLQKTIDSLRTLFLDVTLRATRHSSLKTASTKRENAFQFQSLQEKNICEKASTKLAAFLKGVQVRMLKKRHYYSNTYFPLICDTLKNIYDTIFSIEKRKESFGIVVRNFFNHETMEDFVDSYDASRDFIWDVIVQTYCGTSELTRDYVILCRYIIYCQTDVPLCIHLFCSTSNYVLRVIDNDTGQEIYRFTVETLPTTYTPNTYGYTVIGFAWHEDVKLINWKLVIISDRKIMTPFYVEEIKSVSYTTFENYVPICQNIIGKHTILIKEYTLFAMRFSCSYKNVKFNIKLFDPDRNLLIDIYGTEKIIIPSVALKCAYLSDSISSVKTKSSKSLLKSKSSGKGSGDVRRSSDKNISKKGSLSARKIKEFAIDVVSEPDSEPVAYNLEIYVVDNSWPLTIEEWKKIKILRENTYFANIVVQELTQHKLKDSHSKTLMKSTKDFRKSVLKRIEAIEKPWYLLQYSFRANGQAVMIKDKRDENELFELKKSWYDADSERYQRSVELRQKYLSKYTDPGCECPEEYNVTRNSSESQVNVEDSSKEELRPTPSRVGDDVNVIRTTKCPRWSNVDIPPFDLSPYYRSQCPCPLEFRKKYVKTPEDHAADRRERQRAIDEYNISITNERNNLDLWMNENQENRTLVEMWYADCRKASERVMHDYYIMRQNCIDKYKAQIAAVLEKKPQKKSGKK